MIAEYEAHHQAVWPEILESIKASGILECRIYRVENRLTMVLSTTDDFDFNQKAITDKANLKVQEWETLMWKYQEALPTAKPGEKWILMKSIFQLS